MKIILQAGLAILASAAVGATAAAAESRYIFCSWDHRPNHIVTKPFAYDPWNQSISTALIKAWWAYVGDRFGLSYAEINKISLTGSFGANCTAGDSLDYLARFDHNYQDPKWVRIDFPKQFLGKSLPESGVSSKPRADIIIEDSKPTMRSPAEMQKIVLQEQRDDAARRAKTMAAAVKENAKAKDMLAKLLEKERKRGRSQ